LAAIATATNSTFGHTVPPARLWVFSTTSSREHGEWMSPPRTPCVTASAANRPAGPGSGWIMQPLRAAGAAVS
jgi:hypothetical protein